MKILATLLLVLSFFSAFSQQNSGDPTLYLNKKEVNFINLKYLNPGNIDSIRVDKSTKNGALYISTKKGTKYLTLDKIVKKYTDLKVNDKSLLFQINDDIVYDISNIKIDASYFFYVEVKDVSEVKYIDEKFKGMKIVIIDLEEEERKPEILIRG